MDFKVKTFQYLPQLIRYRPVESRLQTIFTDPGYTSMTYRFTDYNPNRSSLRTTHLIELYMLLQLANTGLLWNITDAVYGNDTSPVARKPVQLLGS